MPEIVERSEKRRRTRPKPSDMVKVDADHLREEILKRYTLADMAFMIDRQANYFSPSGVLGKTGMDINNLEKNLQDFGERNVRVLAGRRGTQTGTRSENRSRQVNAP